MKSKVKKIIILGGGAAGWFTAGYLKTKNPEIDITLIESEKVGVIGVGESTIPQLATSSLKWELKNVIGCHIQIHFIN